MSFPNCKRSVKGNGFTRRDNLADHQRRRHKSAQPTMVEEVEQPPVTGEENTLEHIHSSGLALQSLSSQESQPPHIQPQQHPRRRPATVGETESLQVRKIPTRPSAAIREVEPLPMPQHLPPLVQAQTLLRTATGQAPTPKRRRQGNADADVCTTNTNPAVPGEDKDAENWAITIGERAAEM